MRALGGCAAAQGCWSCLGTALEALCQTSQLSRQLAQGVSLCMPTEALHTEGHLLEAGPPVLRPTSVCAYVLTPAGPPWSTFGLLVCSPESLSLSLLLPPPLLLLAGSASCSSSFTT